jgi:hypothetical protein
LAKNKTPADQLTSKELLRAGDRKAGDLLTHQEDNAVTDGGQRCRVEVGDDVQKERVELFGVAEFLLRGCRLEDPKRVVEVERWLYTL